MALLLGLDFEATDKVPETSRITEIGAILYDTASKVFLTAFSALLYNHDYPTPEPGAVEASGITLEMLQSYGVPPRPALIELKSMAFKADYIVAHNGLGYDKPLWEAECKRHELVMPGIPWIDTMGDLPYPDSMTSRKLDHLVSDHNIPWDRRLSHRAVFDVAKMLLMLSQYGFDEVLAYASEPMVVLKAQTTVPWKDGGASNAKAKARGFRWQEAGGKNYKDAWVKAIKLSRLAEEIQAAQAQGLTIVELERK